MDTEHAIPAPPQQEKKISIVCKQVRIGCPSSHPSILAPVPSSSVCKLRTNRYLQPKIQVKSACLPIRKGKQSERSRIKGGVGGRRSQRGAGSGKVGGAMSVLSFFLSWRTHLRFDCSLAVA